MKEEKSARTTPVKVNRIIKRKFTRKSTNAENSPKDDNFEIYLPSPKDEAQELQSYGLIF